MTARSRASAAGRPPRETSQDANVRVLEVRLGAERVGTLTHLAGDTTVFAFDRSHVENPDRPTLSLGFKTDDGGVVADVRPTRVKLPPFFSNLLPEGHLREYLAERGGVHPDREFFLLWLLGADLPGAIEIHALDGELPPRSDLAERRAEGETNETFRFSLAGVQLKFSAVMEANGGLTVPVNGIGGDWIAKLPSPRFAHVPENEYAMMTLAAAVGIDVPEVRLVKTATIAHLPSHLPEAFGQTLAIRRFDRPGPARERVHIEDFAQVFGVYPADKYAKASYGNLARVLWLETGERGISEYVRRLVFNVLIGNGDAHLKNWSLIYRDRRTPALAPAYDLVATIPYIPSDQLGLSLGGTKRFSDITPARFIHFAEQTRLPVRIVQKIARETTERVRDLWPSHEPARALSVDVRRSVSDHMARVPL